ncbi:uncharacterized protein I303_105170 [Kwoniella dejecticola CBS 10117]|uniref:Uncharacterized protein n=1 Tax=Kwoniella dejecticola CBS 10117 TaxID=1296121 RepID=A0A1A6A391_9TREE|nr:uncharacterized protein I303_05383 [Kwoniella dejecticola CBS 10117]OBR84525.1 hypothetical protein I303_05383 [Kwoniella dejecticola CBS 10117]
MASMDDLLATFSKDLRGEQGDNIRDLQAKLAQTLNNPIPYQQHRPIPPPAVSTTSNNGGGPFIPPPAPASSWNTPPAGTQFLFSSSPQPKSFSKGFLPSPSNGNSTLTASMKKDSGFLPTTIPERDERPSNRNHNDHSYEDDDLDDNGNRPYHASVLPVEASPKETNGFVEDAFRPIWDGKEKDQWSGFKQKST